MIIIALLASSVLTGLIRRYLLRRNILDIPNARSSHSVPTPRGGGLSIVVVFLLAVLLFVRGGTLPVVLVGQIIGGGLTVASAGFLDDHFRISARLRLLMHIAAAAWALWQLNGVGPLYLGWISWNWSWIGQLVSLVGLVWMVNLYNFMDGIDGLAGVEALCTSGLGWLLLARSELAGPANLALVMAAACAGFLVWNWPPAKVFMGDAGSGFLGFIFGVLLISTARERPLLLWPLLILLSVFITDSMLTLLRRLFSGARWYEAHCSHAYQHAARRCGSHAKVTLTIAVINVAWLFPLAWGACVWPSAGPLFAVVAMAPLVYMAFHYDAGRDRSVREVSYFKAEVPSAVGLRL